MGRIYYPGFYYRCPVILEEADLENPRLFVLGQLVAYNKLSGIAEVQFHDLLGTSSYYGSILSHTEFPAKLLRRCPGMIGSVAECDRGQGTLLEWVRPEEKGDAYRYYLRLSDGTILRKPETEIRLEYSQMDYSVYSQLRRYELQNPSWFLNRFKVSRNVHLTRNAAYGFQILAGCRAFLLPHQVSAIARCLETRPVRYMLADEVGLGKTVEACSILKILQSENNRLRTLIIAPEALTVQWKTELRYKYQLSASFSLSDSLCLLPMERLNVLHPAVFGSWDLVIVDETHRLLGHWEKYGAVQKLSVKTPHILLLSATPIQDRNEEYRRLLALLSPQQYADMEPEHFLGLVRKQKATQTKVNQQLRRLDHYGDYAEEIRKNLRIVAEKLEDTALRDMADEIDLNAADRGETQARRTIAYICENYRVERRVIRNRRRCLTESMTERTLCALPYRPLSSDELYNETGVIEAVLSCLSEQSDGSVQFLTDCVFPLLGALFSSPWALENELQRLRIQDPDLLDLAAQWRRQASQELDQMEECLNDPDRIQGRLLRVMDYIDQTLDLLANPDCKIVVFSAYSGTLSAFTRMFRTKYGKQGLSAAVFCKGMEREELEDSVYAFQNDPDCRAIVCDETGGEGRNFQNAELIIHLDLPWNANTLEQRIGRLDRLGRDPDRDVLSVVPFAEGTVEEQLFRIWRDGMGLFSHSLSGLEIITGELNQLIGESLLEDFHHGLDYAFQEILDQAEEMRDSVEDEQLYDIGATLYRPLAEGVEHILKLYAEDGDALFAQAMRGWANQSGLGEGKPAGDRLLEFQESRFSAGSAIQSLFAPPRWGRYADSEIFRRERKLLGSFDRTLAAQREDILFFAPGDPLYDAIVSNAMGCSRGRCCAMQLRGSFSYVGFLFIYQVHVPLHVLLDAGVDLRTLYQYRMFLPLEPIVVSVGLNESSRAVPTEDLSSLLQAVPAYSAEHLGRRGSRMGRAAPLDSIKTDISQDLIKAAYQRSMQTASMELRRQSRLEAAVREMERVLNGLRAECQFLHRSEEPVREKEREFTLTQKALEQAGLVLDACCFLRVEKGTL